MSQSDSPFSRVEDAIEDIRNGKMVIIVDSPDRENEGDLCMAAEFVTADDINFMARHGRGLICLTADARAVRRARAAADGAQQRDAVRDGLHGLDRGPRGHRDRHLAPPIARTPSASPSIRRRAPRDLIHPGHVFPLRARPGGVLERTGQTEASVDLARLAGCRPAGVICEVMKEDGTMARVPDLVDLLRRARHRADHGGRPDRLPAPHREARRAHGGGQPADRVRRLPGGRLRVEDRRQAPPGAASTATSTAQPDVLVRVHSECVTGDVFHSLRCDCGEQLDQALRHIVGPGPRRAAVPGAGGPRHRAAQQAHAPTSCRSRAATRSRRTPSSASRPTCASTASGRRSCVDLGLTSIRILTNNPRKIAGSRGVRPDRHRAGGDRDDADRAQPRVPARQARQARASPAPPAPEAAGGHAAQRAAPGRRRS